ncbi:hypothetical protein RUMHYD_01268 [Blautia hydrogenotrophica DSM 10507]|uniref:Uncharacterized protein n=1 Tax=Blautia hydrogenotrophica (strain DSM 10507 / JCM 14656 / S5a33) TaxID=476272 RepID=C0CK98_BLAHS|nr:hypothetical protein RUMHYD_01268 [Blautia hydrogenotrophica DSM 10507]
MLHSSLRDKQTKYQICVSIPRTYVFWGFFCLLGNSAGFPNK